MSTYGSSRKLIGIAKRLVPCTAVLKNLHRTVSTGTLNLSDFVLDLNPKSPMQRNVYSWYFTTILTNLAVEPFPDHATLSPIYNDKDVFPGARFKR